MTNAGIPASQRIALLAVIDPDANGNATYSTSYIDMQDWHRIAAIILVGDMASTSTLDAKFEQAITDGGTAKDVTSKAITQLTQAGTDSNKQTIIDLCQEDLDFANGYRFVRLTVVIGTAASDSAAMIIGIDPVYGPAEDYNLATVDEIV